MKKGEMIDCPIGHFFHWPANLEAFLAAMSDVARAKNATGRSGFRIAL